MSAEFISTCPESILREGRRVKTSDPGKEPVFSLLNAQLVYEGRVVLSNLSLNIAPGERVALVGKSGVGKSTLLGALREQLPNGSAWCPQQPGLVAMLSVYHNIYMGGLHRHTSLYNLLNLIKPLPQGLGEVAELAQLLGLDKHLFDRVEQISGGQAQRVAIGRALYQQKNIFLGDEPVSAVDDYQAQQLLTLIAKKHETLVLALHDVELALHFCDRIIGLKGGAIVLDAPSSDLNTQQLADLYC
ncbi:MAG: ATP-binding cassette domain-containing protein [Gammaproteobacteria bacterium]|nr:ATP-binding cassette domain-containing protein [Gammaproteobacteria bacterium]MBQ0840646.1 ATP-binding cassette domain-containing protein [Gammaproteobacteria bacterium]